MTDVEIIFKVYKYCQNYSIKYMKAENIYSSILKKSNVWNYYNKDIIIPDISDVDDCYQFIIAFIKYSEKSKTILFKWVGYLKENSPRRLSHIVSAFFLGLWFYHHKRNKYVHDAVKNELSLMKCFQLDSDDIDRQFAYVWFMGTLFHDLGYYAEDKQKGEPLPYHTIPYVGSVPNFYSIVYERYYEYRKNREHGIYAGLMFDKDICDIRRYQEHDDNTQLSWRKELDELYHYVAWIILAHNIWMVRDNDQHVSKYRENNLNELVLSSEKNINGKYKEYRVHFKDYPLFTFFCLIDTIEPTKAVSCLSDIDIKLEGKKIIVKSNDASYRKKVADLNDWLLPVSVENEVVTIWLVNDYDVIEQETKTL